MSNDHEKKSTSLDHYDKDWIYLISQAKQAGISRDEIHNFLRNGNKQREIVEWINQSSDMRSEINNESVVYRQ